MELIFLNPENTLLIHRVGAPPKRNGYLTEISLSRGESVGVTVLASGQTFSFVAEEDFYSSPPPAFSVWQGQGKIFLLLKNRPIAGMGIFLENALASASLPHVNAARAEGNAPLSLSGEYPFFYQTELATGGRLCAFLVKEQAAAPPYGRGAYALFSKEGKLLYLGRGESLFAEGDFFTVQNRFPSHRAHVGRVRRSIKTGQAVSFSVTPTACLRPAELPPGLTPVLFMEEVLLRGFPGDFLCRSLHGRERDFFAFFGEVLFFIPYGEEAILLFYAGGKTELARFALREGLIYDVTVE